MSQITFRADYSQSFRAGVDCPQPPTVTLDVDPAALGEDDRDLIAGRLEDDGKVRSRDEETGKVKWGDTYGRMVTATAPTVEALLIEIRRQDDAAATYKQRKADEEARRQAERVEDDHRTMASPSEGNLSIYLAIDSLGNVSESANYGTTYRPSGADVVAAEAVSWTRRWVTLFALGETVEGKARKAQLDAETAANKQAAIDAATVALRARLAEMREWIEAHGSARLKKLADAGIAHRQTYLRERAKSEQGQFDSALAADRPGWYETIDSDVSYDVADVSLRTLALLDAARAVEPSAKLAKRKSDGRYVCVAEFRGKLIAWPQESA